MKAVQIVNPSEMKVVELEKPVVGAGEVLVRIKYVGFCGSDLNTFLGRNPMVKLPVVPGHEVGAVIEEIGPDVPVGFEKGMNVTLNPYTNCGKCASCRNGRVNACEHNETLGVQRNGVMCEYAVLPWTKIIPAGDISPRDCALIEPMSVGFHAVSRGQVIDNEYVMVIGCGMIGIGAIVRAALRGAIVIAVDLDDEKLELARRMGASHTVNSKTEDVHSRIQEITEGFGADVVIEAVGSPVTYVMAVDEVAFQFNSRLRFTPAVFREIRMSRFFLNVGTSGRAEKTSGGIEHYDGVFVGHVLRDAGHRAEIFVAKVLAHFPELLHGHLLLIDLVDHPAGVFLFGECGLLQTTAVAVVEDRNPNHVLVGLGINTPSRVLRPRPVECVAALSIAALQGLALGIDRREQRFLPGRTPAARRPENPLHLLVAADFDNRGLMTRGNDDGVVRRVIVDRVDMCPVAADANARNVAEVLFLIHCRKISARECLAGAVGIKIQADSPLVERFDNDIAVRIQNFPQAPIVNHSAGRRNFHDNVAHRADISAVRTFHIVGRYTQQIVAVLGLIKRM